MSPTIFRYKGYRFYFFSREEERMHVHVMHADGEAKIWIQPRVELCSSVGLSSKQLKEIIDKVSERQHDIEQSWKDHFGQ
jgi:hypothetical protein